MAEKQKNRSKESTAERGARFFRNFNIFVGGAALAGAAILPPVAAPLSAYAGFNFLQAGGSEAVLRYAKKRRLKKEGEGTK